jgi:hypothetical protein
MAIVSSSSAGTCVTGSLASYVALGVGGCTIGGDTFSNFMDLGGTFGATQLNPAAVTITPLGGSLNPGLTASVRQTATGSIVETMFSYDVSGITYIGESITLSGASETGTGAVSDIQNYCEGGNFGPNISGCAGTSGTLLTVDGVQNQDSATFDPPHFLNLIDDLTLDGTGGSASGASITDRFTAVPEPTAVMITVLGFTFLIASKSRFRRVVRSKDKGVNV